MPSHCTIDRQETPIPPIGVELIIFGRQRLGVERPHRHDRLTIPRAEVIEVISSAYADLKDDAARHSDASDQLACAQTYDTLVILDGVTSDETSIESTGVALSLR